MPSQQANVHKMAINTQLSPRLGNKKASAIHSNSWHSLQRVWVSNARAIYKIWRPLFTVSHTAAAKASHIAVCLISTQRFHPIVAQTTARPQTLAFKRGEDGNFHEERNTFDGRGFIKQQVWLQTAFHTEPWQMIYTYFIREKISLFSGSDIILVKNHKLCLQEISFLKSFHHWFLYMAYWFPSSYDVVLNYTYHSLSM